ncbi:WD40-repeat-containing domain protein [Fusarium acuminatum]|uniref:WD40-repeat-containing domain protein n=1 Tax=Fusarium acuminatum TaxID=5515 RepID=A0ABZ2X8K1_9HYPO
MRTRTSNRTKRYTVEKYDFEGSSDEENLRRAAKKAERDENFDETAAAEESADEEELALDPEQENEENEDPESEGPVSEPDGIPDRFARQRVRPIRPFNVRAAGLTGYLDLEPVADGRIVRSYWGPYDRGFKGKQLVEAWYGRHEDGVKLVKGMLDRWMDWTVLPPKTQGDEEQKDRAVWSPNFFEREAYSAEHWYERVRESLPEANARIRLSVEEAQLYRFQTEPMPVLLGPATAPQEIKFEAGDAYSISQNGLPTAHGTTPVGWMLDAGGIVTGMDWAPLHSANAPQLLALCVIPHSDQELYDYEQESQRPDFQKYGVVQLWEFVGERQEDGFAQPSSQSPTLRKTICLEHGRARRVKWSPACGFLAILCDDGDVYVIEAGDDGEGGYEKVVEPIAVFGFPDEDVKATSFTWINFNRLVVGYTDGSIAIWSLRPHRLLSRHPVHHNIVVDLVSGYPAMPYLIASTPVGGTVKLLDLRAPSFESTEVQNLIVGTQPNLLGYSDHLLGFYSMYPSAGVLNTHVGFMHHSQFPVARRVFTGESFPSCLAVGRTHPYLLIGSLDGSLWAINPQVELFTTRREPTDRIRIFHHEHRPAKLFPDGSPAAARGVSRVATGFILERSLTKHSTHKPPVKKGKKPKKKETDTAVGDDEEEDGGAIMDPTRAIIYEPLTRITVAEWNPNEEYGCWAAVAMGSGLVRIMDLGLAEPEG